jgi:prepilin-type N-terminal cleavage/methylation domain-containing protein
MKSSKISRGFTLIELLVVIAIIAILAAILFPVFAQARRQAYKAVGTSNIKQAALAILMYAQDFDEKMPRAGWSCDAGGTLAQPLENACGATDWQNVTQPYTKTIGIYKNPGDGSVGTGPRSWGGTDLNASDGNFSILINDLLSHQMPTASNGFADANNQTRLADGISLGGINAPADCVLILEGHCGWNKLNANSSSQAWDTVLASGKTCRQDPESKLCKEHTVSGYQTQLLTSNTYSGAGNVTGLPFYAGGGVVGFSDGHAKFVRYSDSAGNPTLCSTLPWSKSIDPQQRGADNTAAYCDPNGPAPPGSHDPQSNWT